jgi:hypothetical protein
MAYAAGNAITITKAELGNLWLWPALNKYSSMFLEGWKKIMETAQCVK